MFQSKKDLQKSVFFSDFYHTRMYEGYKDVNESVKQAANKANLSLDTVVEALLEIENQRLKALAMTEDSAVVVWFTANAGALANIIKNKMIPKGSL